MAMRRPNLGSAGADLAFAAAAFVGGAAGLPVWALVALVVAMAIYWGWSRRAALSRMKPPQLAVQAAVSITILVAVLAGAFWLGGVARGAFT